MNITDISSYCISQDMLGYAVMTNKNKAIETDKYLLYGCIALLFRIGCSSLMSSLEDLGWLRNSHLDIMEEGKEKVLKYLTTGDQM